MSPSTSIDAGRWFVCQIGGRENYAVARALHRHGALQALVTDAWVPQIPGLRRVAPKLAARYHDDLARARVEAPTIAAIVREGWDALRHDNSFDRVLRRNQWFQRSAIATLSRLAPRNASAPITVFSYSYAARDIFRFAKSMGWRTVLGQIDPGPVEDRLVMRLHAEQGHAVYRGKPDSYWESWREEAALADVVIANSDWSRAGLEQEGVEPSRIRVVPLAYEPSAVALAHRVELPDRFTDARPMRALFLGQVILRKGIVPLFDAIRAMRDEPVEFHFVGARTAGIPADLAGNRRVVWHGQVPRNEIDRFYRQADVFLFPTLSDGFGLTQLEALAWGVPVIASTHCGAAITDRVNGVVLAEVTPGLVTEALRRLLAEPALIARLSAGARATKIFGLDDLFFRIAGLR